MQHTDEELAKITANQGPAFTAPQNPEEHFKKQPDVIDKLFRLFKTPDPDDYPLEREDEHGFTTTYNFALLRTGIARATAVILAGAVTGFGISKFKRHDAELLPTPPAHSDSAKLGLPAGTGTSNNYTITPLSDEEYNRAQAENNLPTPASTASFADKTPAGFIKSVQAKIDTKDQSKLTKIKNDMYIKLIDLANHSPDLVPKKLPEIKELVDGLKDAESPEAQDAIDRAETQLQIYKEDLDKPVLVK